MIISKVKQNTIREFTRSSKRYDRPGNYEMVKEDYLEVADELAAAPFETVLDCGCGTGALIMLLIRLYPDAFYTGIDITPAMIEIARQKTAGTDTGHIAFLAEDCEPELPFPDASFDIIICCHSFHHFTEPQKFIMSASRVLTPGGRLILRDNTGSPLFLLYNNWIRLPLKRMLHNMGDVRFYNQREIRKFCLNAGLVIEKYEIRPGNKLHCVIRRP